MDFFTAQNLVGYSPILIASPYPFNRSESSRIECFSNDQGMISSMTIIASMLDNDKNNPPLKSSQNNLTNNESVILTIAAPFNYSQLYSKIECRSKYHHGEQKTSHLEVLSVAEIPQAEVLSIDTYTKQMVTLSCFTYGTDVSIHWDFSDDMSKDQFGLLPIGTRLHRKFTINDTLIIDHVSYSDHRGYYRCHATNKLLDVTYEDKSIIYLNIRKNTIWILILIVCVVIGVCILLLILCSKYYQTKRKNQLKAKQNSEELIDKIKQIIPSRELIEFSPDYNRQRSSEQIVEYIEESNTQQTLSHNESSTLLLSKQNNPLSISKMSPQFILSNPFLDLNVRPLISIKQYE